MPRSLDQYRKMRDFAATPEPSGEARPAAAPGLRFVVQEHHATALHWDFRLERDGVLVSWALPKGVPPDPKENHRAIQTEDHPLEYANFEGNIPEKQYGAGNVTIWDRGTYDLVKWWDNEVQVVLHGERVTGKYVLFRTDGKDWMIHRMDPPQDPDREPMPASVEPMLAKPGTLPVGPGGWAFEIKWDGVRTIAFVKGGRIRLQTRNLNDSTRQFPELAELGLALGSTEVVLDGEIVALDDAGLPRFERLQNRLGLTRPADVQRRRADTPIVYMIFDILYLNGRSLVHLPLRDRRALLEGLTLAGPCWQTPPSQPGDPAGIEAIVKSRGMEGLVAKRLDSPYTPGVRSGAWTKVKYNLSQEFVIGGWTPGAGARDSTLGALLIGYYDRTRAEAAAEGASQRLHFAGKVGTGFDDRLLRRLMPQLLKSRIAVSPFDVGQPEEGSQFVTPELVCEVAFTEWTEAGTLRHPSFKGLRDDKDPRDVILETAESGAPAGQAVVGRQGPGARERRRVTSGSGAPPARATAPGNVVVNVEGRQLALTNLGKVLYPSGFTKAQVIDYYTRIAPVALPHYENRALTLVRYPNGSNAPGFFEKDSPAHRPGWVHTTPVWSRHNEKAISYVMADDVPHFVFLANLAALELHLSLSKSVDVERPTCVVFDLDPGPPAGVIECAEVALTLRDLFASLHLQCVVKTSGSKGLQLYVPLNTPVTYDDTKAFSNAVARLLERQMPKKVVSSMNKAIRAGKVFIDWSQNDAHKTTIGVYSLRAKDRPTVSTPVRFEELEAAVGRRDAGMLTFEAPQVLNRVMASGDLFAPMNSLMQSLPTVPV